MVYTVSPKYQKKQVDEREVRGAETRARITAAVWKVMAEEGLESLTIRKVGDVAGISHAMVHYHFDDKEELIRSVVPYARHYWIDPMRDLVESDEPPIERLEQVITWMAEPATSDVMRVHRELLAHCEWDEELRVLMAAEYVTWRSMYISLFEAIRDDGCLEPGADVELVGTGLSELADHLVGKQALDPSINAYAVMTEMVRPFLCKR
jgi:TetR/AcrR family transcriptional repressor of bet genes